MSREQIIEKIEMLISAIHESVNRLKGAEPNNTPAIEVALLESKLVTFYQDREVSFRDRMIGFVFWGSWPGYKSCGEISLYLFLKFGKQCIFSRPGRPNDCYKPTAHGIFLVL